MPLSHVSPLTLPATTPVEPDLDLGGLPFGPELQLLFKCCALGPREKIQSGVRSRLAAVSDWSEVLRLAEHHGVTPLVYQALRDAADAVPASVLDDLQRRYEHNARRNLTFTVELFRVMDCLEACGVKAIPYKGPALAEAAYGNLALREFSDLDLLVRRCDVQRAKEAVKKLGYTPAHRFTQAEERAYLESGYEFVFDGPAGRNLLEIQFAIVPRFYAINFDLDGAFERVSHASVGGRQMRALSPEDLLLALCVHAAKHVWIRLCWLRDIASVIESQPPQWDLVAQEAKALGVKRILNVSLVLAHRWLGASVPNEALAASSQDQTIVKLCDEIAGHIGNAEEYSTESFRYFRLMADLREHASDKLRFALRLALTPSLGEWSVLKLPEPLFPLYRVIRLFRLAGRLFSFPAKEEKS